LLKAFEFEFDALIAGRLTVLEGLYDDLLYWSEDDLLRAKLGEKLPTLRIIAIAIITPILGVMRGV